MRRTASASPIGLKLPYTPEGLGGQARAPSTRSCGDIGGVVTRVGDETVGEMWSLWDGKDILNEIDPRFAENIEQPHPPRASSSIRSMSPPTPIPRATARSARRTRTPTCWSMSSRRPMPASSFAAPNTRPPRPMPTRPSSSRRSPTGATRSSPNMRSAASSGWMRRA